jgi:hypothetical protein
VDFTAIPMLRPSFQKPSDTDGFLTKRIVIAVIAVLHDMYSLTDLTTVPASNRMNNPSSLSEEQWSILRD